jgi:hypothetical protein
MEPVAAKATAPEPMRKERREVFMGPDEALAG